MKTHIEKAWEDRNLLHDPATRNCIEEAISMLDKGEIRIAEKRNAIWMLNEWIKKAVMLYFPLKNIHTMEVGMMEYRDKIPLKKGFESMGIRVVPPAVARYGSFLGKGVVMMPSYVNIGAYVGENTMVDTWTTVGSCAQIGKEVHLSGGVGIGGVLEPIGANPVIIEDHCFIGSRCIIVEGAVIEEGAVLGANTVITGSSKIIDVRGEKPVEWIGRVPKNAVVIPGSRPKKFPAGEFQVSCALIIGERKESTDRKTSLNETLREFSLEG